MGEHTPTPWAVETPMGDETPWIVEAGKETYEWRCIAMTTSDDPVNDEDRDPVEPLTLADAAFNAAFIVLACNNHARLTRENEAMRKALEPFAAVAEHDIGDDEANTDFFRPMLVHNRAPQLTVGALRRANDALASLKEPTDAQ